MHAGTRGGALMLLALVIALGITSTNALGQLQGQPQGQFQGQLQGQFAGQFPGQPQTQFQPPLQGPPQSQLQGQFQPYPAVQQSAYGQPGPLAPPPFLDESEGEGNIFPRGGPIVPVQGEQPANWSSSDIELIAPAAIDKPPEKPADPPMSAVWRHGVWIESNDKAFKLHPGGRLQYDWVWLDAGDDVQFAPGGVGPIRDGVNFRRVRFAMEGALYEVMEFNVEWDFINTVDDDPATPAVPADVINTPAPTDLWVQVIKLPFWGTIRVGNMKPPLSMEHLTSSRYLPFLERSLGFDAFIGGLDNGFRPGIMFFNASQDDNMTWALGVFKNNTTVFGWNQGDGELDVTGRVTWTPYYEQDGRYMMHLGLGGSHRDLDQDLLRLRARTLLRNGPAPLHTPLLNILLSGDDETIVAPEFAMNCGPWTVQSEYYAVWATDATLPAFGGPAANNGDSYFQSAYVQLLCFLTGEHQPYNRKGGSGAAFGRVIPNSNWTMAAAEDGTRCHGTGAWQVGVRYSWIDLNDQGIAGGTVNDCTVGLSWFLNPNFKVQWNYSVADRSVNGPSDGIVHGGGVRTAFDW